MLSRPIVIFEPRIFTDIVLAALVCDVEVSGFAKIDRTEDNTYKVYGAPTLYDQSCSIHHTKFDMESHNRWIQRMIRNGKGGELPRYRLWWHSHVWAPVYLSPTDRTTIDKIFGNNFDWILAVVVNKMMDVYIELNVFRPERLMPIPIYKFSFSEKFSREDFSKILERRRSRINKLVSGKVISMEPENEN